MREGRQEGGKKERKGERKLERKKGGKEVNKEGGNRQQKNSLLVIKFEQSCFTLSCMIIKKPG
jgi:hypothetical protein